jgi:hypothetical protein
MDIFEPLKDYEKDYSINRKGEVYSNKYKKILIPYIDKKGYVNFGLCKDKKPAKHTQLHILLTRQFIPNPNNYTTIDHIDRNPTNNNLNNLRWANWSIQARNRHTTNNSGYKNIRITKYSYRVVITLNKKCIFDKSFKTIDEALSERDCAFDYYGIENNCYN